MSRPASGKRRGSSAGPITASKSSCCLPRRRRYASGSQTGGVHGLLRAVPPSCGGRWSALARRFANSGDRPPARIRSRANEAEFSEFYWTVVEGLARRDASDTRGATASRPSGRRSTGRTAFCGLRQSRTVGCNRGGGDHRDRHIGFSGLAVYSDRSDGWGLLAIDAIGQAAAMNRRATGVSGGA